MKMKQVLIRDDYNQDTWSYQRRFATIPELRRKKLEILNES